MKLFTFFLKTQYSSEQYKFQNAIFMDFIVVVLIVSRAKELCYKDSNQPSYNSTFSKKVLFSAIFGAGATSICNTAFTPKKLSCLKSGVEFDMNDILYEFKNLHHF